MVLSMLNVQSSTQDIIQTATAAVVNFSHVMFKHFLRNKLHSLFIPLIWSDSDYLIVIAYSNLRYIYI